MLASKSCPESSLVSRHTADVLTVVDVSMQSRLNLALGALARPLHLDSIPAAVSAVRERPVRAVLLGQASLLPASSVAMGRLASSCGGALIVVLGERTPETSGALLAFGRHGVRHAVDVSTREGLTSLRALIAQPESDLAHRIAVALQPGLDGATDAMRFFVSHLVRVAPSVSSTKILAVGLGVLESSLNSRFHRAHLPSPKSYLAATRLLYAVGVLENPRVSLAQTARRLSYSSPQSFMRHIRAQLGVPGTEFRARYSFSDLGSYFAHRILSKYQDTLAWFQPLDMPVGTASSSPA